ncbi:MAG: hydrogenase iron-sulfur subunit [Candidatus Odinarchaeota archaeon]
MTNEFEPVIFALACNFCGYAGSDMAGVSRLQYPPNIRIVRVMCSGRFDPQFALHALETGIDGVLVVGCHPGDCHYVDGNLKAERMFKISSKLLDAVGIDSERLRLEWVSASEGTKFQRVVTDFTNKLKEIGPNPLKKKERSVEVKVVAK